MHRIGRTGRAGAKGRAFTLVAEEDAEAIANVEKLTGAQVPVFGKSDVRVDLVEKGAKPAEKAVAVEKEVVAEQAKAPEDEAKPKAKRSRKPRDEDDAPREKPARQAKPKGEPRKRRDEDSEPAASGEWNGPRPGFLDVSAI